MLNTKEKGLSDDRKKKDAIEELFYRLLCVHLLVCEFTRTFASVEAEESVQSALGGIAASCGCL